MRKTFIKITNMDIYNTINELKEENSRQHNLIINHQIETNGKVRLSKWIATTALSLILAFTIGLVGRSLI